MLLQTQVMEEYDLRLFFDTEQNALMVEVSFSFYVKCEEIVKLALAS